jgi:hypothetical protein
MLADLTTVSGLAIEDQQEIKIHTVYIRWTVAWTVGIAFAASLVATSPLLILMPRVGFPLCVLITAVGSWLAIRRRIDAKNGGTKRYVEMLNKHRSHDGFILPGAPEPVDPSSGDIIIIRS